MWRNIEVIVVTALIKKRAEITLVHQDQVYQMFELMGHSEEVLTMRPVLPQSPNASIIKTSPNLLDIDRSTSTLEIFFLSQSFYGSKVFNFKMIELLLSLSYCEMHVI